MSVSGNLTKEIKGIAILVIIIVVFSIVLLKFKEIPDAICTAPKAYFNITGNICCTGTSSTLTNCAGVENQTAINSVGSGIDSAVGYMDDPITYIGIIIIIIVVAWLLAYLNKKKGAM